MNKLPIHYAEVDVAIIVVVNLAGPVDIICILGIVPTRTYSFIITVVVVVLIIIGGNISCTCTNGQR